MYLDNTARRILLKNPATASGEEKLGDHQRKSHESQNRERLLQKGSSRHISSCIKYNRYPNKQHNSLQQIVIPYFVIHDQPHDTMTGIAFSGEIVIASTGQYILHRWQIWQSAPYLMIAFFVSGSSRKTSVGQLCTHMPQPIHPLIASMVIFFSSPYPYRCLQDMPSGTTEQHVLNLHAFFPLHASTT